MEKIFLDANVLFSAAYQPSSGLLKFWKLKNVKLITSTYALEEALRNLDRTIQQKRLKELMTSVDIIEDVSKTGIPKSVTLPKKDQPILAAALKAKANYLITGDIRHFGKYYSKTISGIKIIPPSHYFNS
jgi:predicted nucleic acid-binding protein